MERTGVCMGCHQNMADETFWTDQVIAKYGRIITDDEHIEHMNHLIQEAVYAGEAPPVPPELGDRDALIEELSTKLDAARADAEAAKTLVDELEQAQQERSSNTVIFVSFVLIAAVLAVVVVIGLRRSEQDSP